MLLSRWHRKNGVLISEFSYVFVNQLSGVDTHSLGWECGRIKGASLNFPRRPDIYEIVTNVRLWRSSKSDSFSNVSRVRTGEPLQSPLLLHTVATSPRDHERSDQGERVVGLPLEVPSRQWRFKQRQVGDKFQRVSAIIVSTRMRSYFARRVYSVCAHTETGWNSIIVSSTNFPVSIR